MAQKTPLTAIRAGRLGKMGGAEDAPPVDFGSALQAAARHAAHDGLAGKEEEEDHRQHHDRGGRHQKFRAGTCLLYTSLPHRAGGVHHAGLVVGLKLPMSIWPTFL